MTTSISSLFQAGLFRKYSYVVLHFSQKTTSFDSRHVVCHFFTFTIDLNIRKFINLSKNQQNNSIKKNKEGG